MAKFKILVSDKLAQEGLDILNGVEGFQVDGKYGLPPEELKKIIGDYDALIVRSGTNVTADIIEAAKKLKVIGRAGVGLDNVDLKAATAKGILAMNTPGGNTTSTAEHSFSMILALARSIPQAYTSIKVGKKWDRNTFKGAELYDKTLGVIGLGRIGSTVAKFAKAFGMKVIAYDPFLPKEIAMNKGVEIVELADLLKTSDFITIHIPKTDETANMISDKEFATVKKNLRIVNCARGGIIDEKALVKALQDKRIAGAALDVFDVEPPDFNSPMFQLDNIIYTPHLGASTNEAQVNVAIEIAHSVRDALLGKGIINAANFPSVDAESYRVLEPYITLGASVAKFAGQLVNGRVSKIVITYSGEVAKYKIAPITLSIVNGLLTPILGDAVNFINALDLAKERGIDIQEITSNQVGEFVNCIKVELITDKEKFEILGTLSANNQPRIVKINDVYAEAIPQGHMIFFNNNDKPGLVGRVGTILAENHINIAAITLSRASKNGVAVSVVNVDSEVPEAVIEKLRATKDVVFVKSLKV